MKIAFVVKRAVIGEEKNHFEAEKRDTIDQGHFTSIVKCNSLECPGKRKKPLLY